MALRVSESLEAWEPDEAELAHQVAEAVGQSHFRESQEGLIQPRIAGEKAVAFKSYIAPRCGVASLSFR